MSKIPEDQPEFELADWEPGRASGSRFRQLLGWMGWPFARALFYVQAWLGTRRWSLLALSSPAWLLGLAVFGMVLHARFGASHEIRHRYLVAFYNALEAADEAVAQVAGRKLIQLDPEHLESRYALAWLAQANGDHQRAEELMRELAPLDDVGHPRAHLWMALRILVGSPDRMETGEPKLAAAAPGSNGETPPPAGTVSTGSASDAAVASPTPTPSERPTHVEAGNVKAAAEGPLRPSLTADDFRALVHHLMIALRVRSQREAAHIMLARLWLAARNYAQCAEHLQAVVATRPDLRMTLADVYLAMGETDRGRGELISAAEHFQKVAESDAANWQARIQWAQCLAKSDQWEAAERVLAEGLPTDASGQIRQALAGLFVAQYDRLARSEDKSPVRGIAHLQRALTYAPNNVEALTRLAVFSGQTGPEADQARTLLKDLLARGEAPAAVHLVLGTQAAAAERFEEAKIHLEQAYRLNPRAPAILNNLAWVLATSQVPQPERALELVNQALQLAPGHPEMLATRGHVHMLLEQWPEALADLEAALPDLDSRANIHQWLAQIYSRLGDAELAQRHRELAEGRSVLSERK